MQSSNDKENKDPYEGMNLEAVCVNTSYRKKTLKRMNEAKAGGEDGLSIDLIKDGGFFR